MVSNGGRPGIEILPAAPWAKLKKKLFPESEIFLAYNPSLFAISKS
jgi:hypothetical protein